MTAYFVDFAGGDDTKDGLSKANAWKRCKGMINVASVAASASLVTGDILIFKGGVTWTSSFPWTLVTGGSSPDIIYTTDNSWFTGASFTQPVIDDGHRNPGSATGTIIGGSHVTMNNFNLVNVATSQVANSSSGLFFLDCHDITLTNWVFAPESQRAILFSWGTPGSYSNFTISGCDFSHCSSAVWAGSTNAGISIHHVRYHDCTAHDFTSQIGGGVHGDGFWHYFTSSSGADATEFADDVLTWNLRSYGDFRISHDPGAGEDMTAFWFNEGPVSGKMWNCDFSFSGTQAGSQFQAPISITHRGKVATWEIYNCSLANSVGTNQMSAMVDIYNVGAGSVITLKNCIIDNPLFFINLEDTASQNAFVSDYNMIRSTSTQGEVNGVFKTYSQWQALGFDSHSIFDTDPSWVASPGNERLNSNSLARNAGTNLSGLGITELNTDYDGKIRGTLWSIGAFEFNSAPSTGIILMGEGLS